MREQKGAGGSRRVTHLVYHGHKATIARGLAGDLDQQIVVTARSFKFTVVEVLCVVRGWRCYVCSTWLEVLCV